MVKFTNYVKHGFNLAYTVLSNSKITVFGEILCVKIKNHKKNRTIGPIFLIYGEFNCFSDIVNQFFSLLYEI